MAEFKNINLVALDSEDSRGAVFTKQSIQYALATQIKKEQDYVFGQVGSPAVFNQLDTKAISHYIKNLRVNDTHLVGDVFTMGNSSGQLLDELIEMSACKFSICGVGFIKPPNNSFDYGIISINAVLS